MPHLTRLFFIGLILLLFSQCKKEEESFKHETFTNPNFCMDDHNCLQVKLDILIAGENHPIKDSINFHIFQMVKENLDLTEGTQNQVNYVDLINTFEKYYTEFAKMSKKQDSLAKVMNWEASALVKLNYETPYFLNFAVEHYLFTGAAHGYGASQSLIVDAITGRKLNYKNMFTDLNEIKRLAEGKLREKYEIGIGTSFNSKGFFFENDKFSLPENIFFNTNGIVLHYNQYEVAPYAFGPIEIELTNKEIDKYFVTKQFKQKK